MQPGPGGCWPPGRRHAPTRRFETRRGGEPVVAIEGGQVVVDVGVEAGDDDRDRLAGSGARVGPAVDVEDVVLRVRLSDLCGRQRGDRQENAAVAMVEIGAECRTALSSHGCSPPRCLSSEVIFLLRVSEPSCTRGAISLATPFNPHPALSRATVRGIFPRPSASRLRHCLTSSALVFPVRSLLKAVPTVGPALEMCVCLGKTLAARRPGVSDVERYIKR